ncbi:MAG: hypothetical protein HUJ31_03330 [Pseudomonadales bacterium]|nr:hypothetical protein [Pseudomonadales bacterium]
MSDAVSTSAASRTQLDVWLAWLGIRTEDRAVTGLLFGNMFLSGLAIGMIRVCGFTLFLKYFSSEQLAIVAILLAITGTLITLVIDRFTAHLSVRGYLFTILGTIFVGLMGYRILLGYF